MPTISPGSTPRVQVSVPLPQPVSPPPPPPQAAAPQPQQQYPPPPWVKPPEPEFQQRPFVEAHSLIFPHAVPSKKTYRPATPFQFRRRGRPQRFQLDDERGFHAGMIAAPHDMLPHLVYADWLDEHERPALAELIRRAVQHGNTDQPHTAGVLVQPTGMGWHTSPPGHYLISSGAAFNPIPYVHVRMRPLSHPDGDIHYMAHLQPHESVDLATRLGEERGRDYEYDPDPRRRMARRRPVLFSREDEQAFHAAMSANYEDELPSLVYADYLEDRGQREAAEIIRRHVQWHTQAGILRRGPNQGSEANRYLNVPMPAFELSHGPRMGLVVSGSGRSGNRIVPSRDKDTGHYTVWFATPRHSSADSGLTHHWWYARHLNPQDAHRLLQGDRGHFHADWGTQQLEAAHPELAQRPEQPERLARPPGLTPQESPHLDEIERAKIIKSPKQRREYESHLGAAFSDKPGVLPTLSEAIANAEAGRSARGEYHRAFHIVKHLFGSDTDAHTWAALNAALSPRTRWQAHTQGAFRIMGMWHQKGRPADARAIRDILESFRKELHPDTGKRLYPMFNKGNPTRNKVGSILSHAARFRGQPPDPALLSALIGTHGKTLNFYHAFFHPSGVPIDTHMAKLLTPEGIESLSVSQEIEAAAKGSPSPGPRHRLVEAIAASGDRKVLKRLKKAQEKLIAKGAPGAYGAYKTLVGHAADEMGWHPNELQEAMWTSIVAAAAMRDLGFHPHQVLHHLQHQEANKAWNMLDLLTRDEGTLRELQRFGIQQSQIDDIRAAFDAAPLHGTISIRHPGAFETAARRIPPGSWQTAGQPVAAAVAGRLGLDLPTRRRFTRPLTKRQKAKRRIGRRIRREIESGKHPDRTTAVAAALALSIKADEV